MSRDPSPVRKRSIATAMSRLVKFPAGISVKLHLRQKQTNLQRDTSVFFCLSVVSARSGHHTGGRSAMLRGKFKKGGGNPGLTKRYTDFGQLIIKKIIKIIATRSCHNLRLKCAKFDSWRLSVCLFVCLCLRWSQLLNYGTVAYSLLITIA